ncbi:hypothetical protein J4406_01280 [Candidatus Woesearchaeota archaeon]|nr:hypothetical protein [Candidatus Woesearchaeota archaeon]
MATLISCLSTGKGTWGHVNRLIEDGKYDHIFLITNDYGKENFNKGKNTELIALNLDQGLKELRDDIIKNLKGKIKETEVDTNFISGTGREHMALMAALLKLGIGIRLKALTKEGIEEI